MNIEGIIYKICDEEIVGSSSFRKRVLALETREQYPQKIAIEFVQDKVDLIDPYGEGQEVKISVNLRGREWINPQGESVFFNTLQGWKIESVDPLNG